MTPISLLASITETRHVSSRSASATFCGSSQPARGLPCCSTSEQRHVVAAAREPRERIEHGFVLGRDADEVIAAAALAFGDAADREVVALGRAAGEDDFLGVGADRRGDRLPRRVDRVAGFVADGVDAVRVAVLLVEVRQHRLDDARIDARRGVVVHVDELVRIGGHGKLNRKRMMARIQLILHQRPREFRLRFS